MSRAKDKQTGLTMAQEAFAMAVACGESQSDAYRKAYPASLKWKEKSIWEKASAMAANVKVRTRVNELRAPAIKACEITVENLTTQLQEDRTLAKACGQAGAAVSATMGIAKLHGLLVEDRKNARDPFEGWGTKEMSEALNMVRSAIDKAKSTGKPVSSGL